MPDNHNNPYQNALVTTLLLLAASYPEPVVNRLAGLSQAINTLREAFNSINNGLHLFYTDVVPLLINETPANNYGDSEDIYENQENEHI